ncbi:HD domain-containing protein [Altererythrobacter sp. GH1-8]|uniref:HD domain-containing protein n=1 Tax=Altererythrobacter sp. GH1-8 TaxID=3349333 RepID=UPI00374DEF88
MEERLNPGKSDTARIIGAASFAAEKHRKQRRKDAAATPYINHPLEVAQILTEAGVEDSDVLIAAILHDTIEDTETTPEELTAVFGERVCSLVLEVTDDKSLPKAERKRLQVLNAPKKSADAKLIKIADKIANIRDLKASPPKWSEGRKASYVLFAREVVHGCIRVSADLEALFEKVVADLTLGKQPVRASLRDPALRLGGAK